jgi:hypothetical protein
LTKSQWQEVSTALAIEADAESGPVGERGEGKL